ncbi:MAG: hypothetical protein EBU46_09140 [Nitrosomonadaceae bacterium]|nr:hypothetical protein [Nitrosomonadaceae bacterium]
MATGRLTEGMLRTFLMDRPELNSLLRGVRWSPEEIEAAMVFAVGYFNESSPSTGNSYTVESFPFTFAWLTGVAGHLLKSAAINETSNNISYQLDGVQVNDRDKGELFARMGQQYWDEFKLMTANIKMQQNVSAAFGSNRSEWSNMIR